MFSQVARDSLVGVEGTALSAVELALPAGGCHEDVGGILGGLGVHNLVDLLVRAVITNNLSRGVLEI